MNYSKIMFFSIMVMGTMITISSNSWLSAWMGLEINLLSFIPLMSDNNLMSNESSLKYFLVQALASCMLLLGMILNSIKYSMSIMTMDMDFSSMMMLTSLILKSGTAPLHWWFPNVMEGLSWINSLILMTWQKIAPLMLISYIIIEYLLYFCIIMSAWIGAIGGLNQTSLRKLMAYSSINHLSWMLMAMMMNESMWLIYFMFYTILILSIIIMFNLFKLFHINQIFTQFFESKNLKFFLFINLLSLGGLPPFMGFIPKWMMIQQMTNNLNFFLMLFLMMMTLIVLFYYLQLCYSAFMMNFYEINVLTNMKNNIMMNKLMLLSFMSSSGLFLISVLYFML
nr:NADH dehydrogenase subunit 2 [Cephalops aeneus]